MPLQINNFAGFGSNKTDHSAIGNAMSNILKGYQAARAPGQIEEEERKQKLANALSQIELQNKPEDYATQFELRRAQAEHARRQASGTAGGLQGHARNIQDLNRLLQDPNVPQEYKDMAVALFKSDIAKGQSLVDTRNQNMQFKNFNAQDTDTQAEIVGKYRNMGINPQDAVELYNAKVTPELLAAYKQQNPGASNHEAVKGVVDYLQSQGQGQQQGGQQMPQSPPMQQPQQPTVQFAPQEGDVGFPQQQPQQPLQPVDTRALPQQPAMTGSNRTDFNNVKGALAEENYIHPIITAAMKPYAKKYAGYSPKQFWDAGKKDAKSVDEMAKFYAARALQPEIAGIRSRMAGGSNAAQALHDIQVEALNKINVLDWRVSPEAYEKAQEYISEWMTGMTQARLNAMSGGGGFSNAIKAENPANKAAEQFDPESDDPFGIL